MDFNEDNKGCIVMLIALGVLVMLFFFPILLDCLDLI